MAPFKTWAMIDGQTEDEFAIAYWDPRTLGGLDSARQLFIC